MSKSYQCSGLWIDGQFIGDVEVVGITWPRVEEAGQCGAAFCQGSMTFSVEFTEAKRSWWRRLWDRVLGRETFLDRLRRCGEET